MVGALGGFIAGEEPTGAGVDCGSVKGLQHNILDTARSNQPTPLEALVGTDISPAKVSIMYRAEGATDFTEVKMTRAGCKFTGEIPAAATHGTIVHYYVAAYDGAGPVLRMLHHHTGARGFANARGSGGQRLGHRRP